MLLGHPEWMGGEYIAMEYAKKPMTKDLGTRILYKQGNMKGWTYKTLQKDDLKMPIVTGEGKRSRLLGTIGVTRGFGDHDLRALGSGVIIKPFLSCHPEVIYRYVVDSLFYRLCDSYISLNMLGI